MAEGEKSRVKRPGPGAGGYPGHQQNRPRTVRRCQPEVMESDTKVVRGNRPYVMTNCKTGEGVVELVDMIMDKFLFTHRREQKHDTTEG